jgi:acetolactate synthase regulatory subunit
VTTEDESWHRNMSLARGGTGVLNRCPRCTVRDRAPGQSYCRECTRTYWREWYHTTDKTKSEMVLRLAQDRGFEIVEFVSVEQVKQRDGGNCQLCHEPVDFTVDASRHPRGATIHHLEPVHSYATVQLAHRECNKNGV